MVISFIAIPGSGKSTQINKLVQSKELKDVISVSIPSLYKRRDFDITEYLTEDEKEKIKEVKEESDLSRKKGFLAPIILDEILFNLAFRLSKLGKTVVIDGGPRGVAQAKLFMDLLPEEEKDSYKVIELYFEEKEEDMSRDRQYVRTINNQELSIEDAISKIVKIPNKITVYLNDTRPGLEYLAQNGIKIGRFEATNTIEKIHEDIMNFLVDR